jgi:hypothetical protein
MRSAAPNGSIKQPQEPTCENPIALSPQIHAVDAKFCILKLRSDSQAGRRGVRRSSLGRARRQVDTIEIAIRDFCKHRSCTGLALWANARGRGFAQSLHHVREKQHLVEQLFAQRFARKITPPTKLRRSLFDGKRTAQRMLQQVLIHLEPDVAFRRSGLTRFRVAPR